MEWWQAEDKHAGAIGGTEGAGLEHRIIGVAAKRRTVQTIGKKEAHIAGTGNGTRLVDNGQGADHVLGEIDHGRTHARARGEPGDEGILKEGNGGSVISHKGSPSA